jgi:hypothetical protein
MLFHGDLGNGRAKTLTTCMLPENIDVQKHTSGSILVLHTSVPTQIVEIGCARIDDAVVTVADLTGGEEGADESPKAIKAVKVLLKSADETKPFIETTVLEGLFNPGGWSPGMMLSDFGDDKRLNTAAFPRYSTQKLMALDPYFLAAYPEVPLEFEAYNKQHEEFLKDHRLNFSAPKGCKPNAQMEKAEATKATAQPAKTEAQSSTSMQTSTKRTVRTSGTVPLNPSKLRISSRSPPRRSQSNKNEDQVSYSLDGHGA